MWNNPWNRAIEKGAFESPVTKVANFTYFIFTIYHKADISGWTLYSRERYEPSYQLLNSTTHVKDGFGTK